MPTDSKSVIKPSTLQSNEFVAVAGADTLLVIASVYRALPLSLVISLSIATSEVNLDTKLASNANCVMDCLIVFFSAGV
jgi:hypothetical protein